METDYTVSKTNVECYKLRHKSGMYWADITIDSKENTGRIQVASDFGSWQYYWGACGCPFKEFLMQIGIDYAASKFGESQWFDFDETIKSYKQGIIELRRYEHFTAEHAREIYDEIKELAEESSYHLNDFQMQIQGKENLMKHFNWCPDVRHDISPQFKKFWKMIWGVFLEELKQEINVAV